MKNWRQFAKLLTYLGNYAGHCIMFAHVFCPFQRPKKKIPASNFLMWGARFHIFSFFSNDAFCSQSDSICICSPNCCWVVMRQSPADVIPLKGYERFCVSQWSQQTRGVVHGLAVLSLWVLFPDSLLRCIAFQFQNNHARYELIIVVKRIYISGEKKTELVITVVIN